MRRRSTVREARAALQRPRGSLLERAAEWLFAHPADERAALDKGARHDALRRVRPRVPARRAAGQVRRWHLGYGGLPEWYALTRAAGTVLFLAGTLLANFTPAALAHHVERRTRRKARRRAKTLADWRGEA